MFKTIEELKQFILWAKSEKVSAFKVGDVEVHVSQIALIEEPQSQIPVKATQETTQKNEDDELLFFSAR